MPGKNALWVVATLLLAPFPGAAEPAAAAGAAPSVRSSHASPHGTLDRAALAVRLPSGEQWLAHFVRDVLPYWSSPQALGDPVGHFPTFRYADGRPIEADRLLDPAYPWLPEATWISARLDRTYTRMISRQAYVLGVAYHLTGDGRYLAWAKAGVDHVLDGLADGEGSFCSWIEDGRCAPAPPRRTAQDLSYALLGPAFYAYLTRDAEVLERIVRTHRAFFDAYRDPQTGLVRWVLEDYQDPPDRFSPEQLELVAQLDPLNAYLLLLAPVVAQERPAADRERWLSDVASLAGVLVERFHAPEHGVFWGRIDAPEHRRPGGHHHTDSGHSGKAYWMLERAAVRLDEAGHREAGPDPDGLAHLARTGGSRLLERVYRDDPGGWSEGWNEDGTLKDGFTWWGYAELDQLAATLALRDPDAGRHLPSTYDFWLTHFVDHRRGGVYPFPVPPGEVDPPILKAHLWKNGYHEAEHALVGYVTANALRGEPVVLYFAAEAGTESEDAEAEAGGAEGPEAGPAGPSYQPYLFTGDAEVLKRLPLAGMPNHERVEVRFRDVG